MGTIFTKIVTRARLLGAASAAAVTLLLISTLAYAATTSNLSILHAWGDQFYNYDFDHANENFEWGSDGTNLGVEPPLGDVD
jgi:hypothetical protein